MLKYDSTARTLTNSLESKVDGNYTRMFRAKDRDNIQLNN